MGAANAVPGMQSWLGHGVVEEHPYLQMDKQFCWDRSNDAARQQYWGTNSTRIKQYFHGNGSIVDQDRMGPQSQTEEECERSEQRPEKQMAILHRVQQEQNNGTIGCLGTSGQ